MIFTRINWTPLTSSVYDWVERRKGKTCEQNDKISEDMMRKYLKKKTLDNTEFERMELKTYVEKWLNVSEMRISCRMVQEKILGNAPEAKKFIPGILRGIIPPEFYKELSYFPTPEGVRETNFGQSEEVQIEEYYTEKVCPRLQYQSHNPGLDRLDLDRFVRFYFEIKEILKRFLADPGQVGVYPTAQGLYFFLCATEMFIMKELCEIHVRCTPSMASKLFADNCAYADFLIAAWTLFRPLREQAGEFRETMRKTSSATALMSAARGRGSNEAYCFRDPTSDRVIVATTQTLVTSGGPSASAAPSSTSPDGDQEVQELQAQ